jgi:hypothetical protein
MSKLIDLVMRFGNTSANSHVEFLKRMYPGLYEIIAETSVSREPPR